MVNLSDIAININGFEVQRYGLKTAFLAGYIRRASGNALDFTVDSCDIVTLCRIAEIDETSFRTGLEVLRLNGLFRDFDYLLGDELQIVGFDYTPVEQASFTVEDEVLFELKQFNLSLPEIRQLESRYQHEADSYSQESFKRFALREKTLRAVDLVEEGWSPKSSTKELLTSKVGIGAYTTLLSEFRLLRSAQLRSDRNLDQELVQFVSSRSESTRNVRSEAY